MYRIKGLLKSSGEKTFTVRSGNRGPRRILIIYPAGSNDNRVARFFLKSVLADAFAKVIVLVKDTGTEIDLPGDRFNLKYYDGSDFDWWGRLTEGARRRIFSNGYDAVVDMNREFDIQSALITAASEAPLRLGFKSELSHLFYNHEVNIRPESFIEKGYVSFQQLLGL